MATDARLSSVVVDYDLGATALPSVHLSTVVVDYILQTTIHLSSIVVDYILTDAEESATGPVPGQWAIEQFSLKPTLQDGA